MEIAWKILGVVAALLLAGAAIISYMGKDAVSTELMLQKRAEANLKATRVRDVEADDNLKENEEGLEAAEIERDELTKNVSETNAEEAEYVAQIAQQQIQLDQIKQKVSDIEVKVRQIGGIKKLISQVDGIKSEIGNAEAQIANREQKLDIATDHLSKVKGEITDYRSLESRQTKGLPEKDFKATVTNVYDRYGFVLVNKGNKNGLYANAELDVKRNGENIGRVRVSRVEQGRSIASVLPKFWAEGMAPAIGDQVVPVPEVSLLPESAEGTPENESVNAPQDDLFGGSDPGPPAPAANPLDIFGSDPAPTPDPAPAAPAPAPAAPDTSDPFGGI